MSRSEPQALGPGVDPGEAAAGSYGEISVTYSSTPYIGAPYGSNMGPKDSSFPWKTKKNQMQEASYPPPSDDLFWSGLFTEISSSARMRAFFRLLSLIP